MGGVKGQFPQPFKDMDFVRSQERLPNNLCGRMLHAVFERLGLKGCVQVVHHSHLLIRYR